MSNVIKLRRPRQIVVAPRDPPDLFEFAELFAARRDALERNDLVRVEEIEALAQELIDHSLD